MNEKDIAIAEGIREVIEPILERISNMAIVDYLEAWFNEIEGLNGFYQAHSAALHGIVVNAYIALALAEKCGVVNLAAHPTLSAWMAFVALLFGVSGVAMYGHNLNVQANQRLARAIKRTLADVEISSSATTELKKGD